MASSQVRQNFHEESEEAINAQINMELYASYVYLSMAFYFDRDDIALSGLSKYFKESSDEEREHAMKLMKYMNKRGGRIVLEDIKAPDRVEWGTAEEAMTAALDLEKSVNEGFVKWGRTRAGLRPPARGPGKSLLNLHKVATQNGDVNLCDFLETEFLQEQVDSIKEIGQHLTNLRRVGEGLGVYVYDKNLH